MSLGKTNNQSALDKANAFLGRLMGKRSANLIENKKPSNNKPTRNDITFIVVLAISGLILWSLTGICYVPDNNYGVISQNGKFKKILKENSIYLTYPYPINDFNIFALEGNKIYLGEAESNQYYYSLTKDAQVVKFSYSFDIMINNPQQFYNNFYQLNENSLKRIKLLASDIVQNYMRQSTFDELNNQNKIILANSIVSQLNDIFKSYGLVASKGNLVNLTTVQVTSSASLIDESESSSPSLIMQQALNYQAIKESQLISMQNDYYSLLKQYQLNPKIVGELLYYRMLSNIGTVKSDVVDYPLLFTAESVVVNGTVDAIKQNSSDIRSNERSVIRQRVLDRDSYND